MNITKQMCLTARNDAPPAFGTRPLQLGMHGDPWKVAVTSMLLCRARWVQADRVVRELFSFWPCAELLCTAEGLESVVRPCGFQFRRARQLVRFSNQWLGTWNDVQDLVGVGDYVRDAIAVFCFGSKELTCNDGALRGYIESLAAA